MAKNESRDSGDEFRHEDQSQKHGVLQRTKSRISVTSWSAPVADIMETHQFQHPGSTFAGGETPEESKQNDGHAGTDEDIRAVGGAVGNQQHVGAQHKLPP